MDPSCSTGSVAIRFLIIFGPYPNIFAQSKTGRLPSSHG